MEENIATNPKHVGLFCGVRVVFQADDVTHLI
jgi:hypothetical protein